jgi:hypothetical protein
LVARLAAVIADRHPGHPLRVAVDGPPWAGIDVVTGLVDRLVATGRPVDVVDVADFLRAASLRLERGRDDSDAFYEDWIDVDALRREVLDPLGPDGSRRWLPTLWDAQRDRATRADYRTTTDDTVVLVRGWFLLGAALPWDLTVHLAVSAAARRRRVPAEAAVRELPAYDRYDAEVAPASVADIVVRCDDPRHPALVTRLR